MDKKIGIKSSKTFGDIIKEEIKKVLKESTKIIKIQDDSSSKTIIKIYDDKYCVLNQLNKDDNIDNNVIIQADMVGTIISVLKQFKIQ